MLELRPYQSEALSAICAADDRGVRRPLVALPTGTGKTVIFAYLLARQLGTDRLAARDAPRRTAPASGKQLDLLRRMRVGVSAALTRGEASDLIAARVARCPVPR